MRGPGAWPAAGNGKAKTMTDKQAKAIWLKAAHGMTDMINTCGNCGNILHRLDPNDPGYCRTGSITDRCRCDSCDESEERQRAYHRRYGQLRRQGYAHEEAVGELSVEFSVEFPFQ